MTVLYSNTCTPATGNPTPCPPLHLCTPVYTCVHLCTPLHTCEQVHFALSQLQVELEGRLNEDDPRAELSSFCLDVLKKVVETREELNGMIQGFIKQASQQLKAATDRISGYQDAGYQVSEGVVSTVKGGWWNELGLGECMIDVVVYIRMRFIHIHTVVSERVTMVVNE